MAVSQQAGAPAPTLRGSRVFGSMTQLRADYLGTLLRAARELGSVARIDAGPPGWRFTFYSISTPDLVPEILGQPDRYTKDVAVYHELRWSLGNGLLSSEGAEWLRQRRLLAPIFTHRRITTAYAAIMVEEAQRLVARWRAPAAAGDHLDAHAEMIGLTSRIIGRILFGADMATAVPPIMRFKFVNEALLMRALNPHPTPVWVPTPANRRLRAGLTEIRRVVDDVIASRRAGRPAEQSEDMLALLLAANQAGEAGSAADGEIADQVLIFLLAGHDTTASTLACALIELARSADWQQAVRDEVDQLLGGRAATAADADNLPWTGRVVREAMRLYPAAHSINRSPAQDETLDGYRIPANSSVTISPWTVHRAPEVWRDPETFDPRRFDVPAGQFPGGHKYAWFPFGAGRRACIGSQLALLEVTLVLATILQAYRVETSVQTVPLVAAVTLHPAVPLPIRLVPRG